MGGGGGGGGGDIKVNLYPSRKKAAIGMEQIEIGFYLKELIGETTPGRYIRGSK